MTHKPLPAAKVKELEEFINLTGYCIPMSVADKGAYTNGLDRGRKAAVREILEKLQSLINEAENAQLNQNHSK